jgi:hypothetical protein
MYGPTKEKLDVYYQAKGYIDRDIFEDWFKDTFLAEVVQRRAKHEYRSPAYLIMDHCPDHPGEQFAEMCQTHDIIQVFLPPHSSHLLQILDLSLFEITKRMISRLNKRQKKYVQMEHIADIVEAFLKSSSLRNIVKSFELAGISLVRDDSSNISQK